MSFKLLGSVYTPFSEGIKLNNLSMKDCWCKVGKSLQAHVNYIKTAHVFSTEIKHYLCSTINGMDFSSGQINWFEVYSIFKQQFWDCIPLAYLDAYECAGWGYALRYHLKYHTTGKIFISIIDNNTFDFEFWKESLHWGKSGFGIMTLLIEFESNELHNLQTHYTTGHNPLFEFALTVKKFYGNESDTVLALPFFPEKTTDILHRILKDKSLLKDYHSKWGHCFGSDPWIALMEYYLNKNSTNIYKYFIMSSFALNGYYSLAKIILSENVIMKIMEAQ